MTDLFESMVEHHSERLAIMQESGVDNAESLAADDLHSYEIKSVMRRYYPDGNKAAEYFDKVEKNRGKEAADRLRDDVRAAWKQRRIEESGQA